MKFFRNVTLMLSLTLFPALVFADDLGRARMGLIQGDVQINSEETGEWFPASVNTPLREGDRLWVPSEGRSEIQILGGVSIRLDAATSFDILSLEEGTCQFFLQQGRVYVNNRRTAIEHIQIDTPLSSIGFDGGSLVMIDVAESGATEISVLKGHAYAETRRGKKRIDAGNALVIGEDLSAVLYPIGSPDEWEQWNRDRDNQLARSGVSPSYLPDELRDFAPDFEGNGRWLYTASYGYVWNPFVAVSINWAPYRIGRWVWCGGNYVWISYESWGWAPYHYGRWAYLPRIGWCWVPPRRGAVFWAPGYVAWVHSSTFVSWLPLAPGDIYYGYGYYGPNSVNINTVIINKIVINRNYINLNVRNAVTTQHRDTFLHGKKKDFSIRENPFRLSNVGIGPPRFKPDKQGMAPVIRALPAAKLPPERVRTLNPDLIRKERRLVRDERGSVFYPGRPVEELRAVRRETPKRPQPEPRPAQRQERTRRQPDMIGPFGTDRPESIREAPATPQGIPSPAVEPSSGVKREERRRPIPPPASATPPDSIREIPDRPAPLKKTRSLEPRQGPIPVAPQPVAPTPVWRPAQPQQPGVQAPEVRQPGTESRRSDQPGGEIRPAEMKRVPQPRDLQQPQVTQPPVKQETNKRQAAPAANQETQRQSGAVEGTTPRSPYQGDRRMDTR